MKIVVFTDLDGTLLDPRDYSYHPASHALEALRERDAALVLVSSKTFVEMKALHRQLGCSEPFVVENGGAVVFSLRGRNALQLMDVLPPCRPVPGDDFCMLRLGASYDRLVASLADIAEETGVQVKGFSSMGVEEIAALTGLTLPEAERAWQRDFDEPFLLQDSAPGNAARVVDAAARRGLSVVMGNRFWHLIGHQGKAKAVALLLDAYRRLYGSVVTVGLGDSPNDFSFLELVDVPVILGPSGVPELFVGSNPRARHIPLAGPRGWNTAILEILANVKEPA